MPSAPNMRIHEAIEGMTRMSAAELAARADVDLHLATELLERGCPAATALRILL